MIKYTRSELKSHLTREALVNGNPPSEEDLYEVDNASRALVALRKLFSQSHLELEFDNMVEFLDTLGGVMSDVMIEHGIDD